MTEVNPNNSNAPVLYGFWLSPYMSLVAHILKESKIGFRYERVSAFVGGTHSTAHKARNPLGKIPSLEDSNGVIISESQAICRYLARSYPNAQQFYPCDDPVRCARVDALNDFLTFSISGPFFNWFVISGYYPQAFRVGTEEESRIYGTWSAFMIKGNLARLLGSAVMKPYMLGSEPCLPDFHLFHILELGKTFSKMFNLPMLNLLAGDEALQNFYDAMSSRTSTQEILAKQAAELAMSQREIFEEFGKAYLPMLKSGNAALAALFGHDV
jgi:glutathione S-transferase